MCIRDRSFYDAIAPIVYRDSIDMSKAWMQSRYDKGETEQERKAYLNCPMTKEQYEKFIDALLEAEKTEFHENEQADYFNGCLPIEVMAERGRETLRFGPMKPVGLTNPNSKVKPYAVVQLRRDNALGTLYNIVGFQTKMKYASQKIVFSMAFGGLGWFRKVREAITLHLVLFRSKSDLMVPSYSHFSD